MLSVYKFVETSPASAGTAASSQAVQGGNGGYFGANGIAGPLDEYLEIRIVASLIGATGGTLDVYLQTGLPDGTWTDYLHFPQLAAGASAVNYVATTAMEPSAITVVGSGLTPALAANTVVGGPWGDRMRLVMVAGSGTSAGAAVNMWLLCQAQFSRGR